MLNMRIALFSLALVGLNACKTPAPASQTAAKSASSSDVVVPDFPDEFPKIDWRRARKVDILGIPFGDTVLNEFFYDRNLGVNNIWLQDDFILRFAHLAEQHGRDFEKLGFESCYDFGPPRDTNDYREKQSGPQLVKLSSLPRLGRDLYKARRCFLQEVRFPESVQWRTSRTPANKQMPRVISLFMPNALTVHLDTNGTWPLGRRPNDDMIGRFNSLFLKQGIEPGDCSGDRDIEALTTAKKEPSRKGLSDAQRCSLESFSRPSSGTQISKFKGWKGTGPVLPLNPPHKIKLASGEVKEKFDEETFPFLFPPNAGRGYYQDVPGKVEFIAWDLTRVYSSSRAFAREIYTKNDPTIGYHPYCTKEAGQWRESGAGSDACAREQEQRFGRWGDVDPEHPGQRAAATFFKSCAESLRLLCREEI